MNTDTPTPGDAFRRLCVRLLITVVFAAAALLFAAFWILSGPARAQSRDDCLACHSDTSLTTERNGAQVPLFVDAAVLGRSPHKKLVCTACHPGFDPAEMPHRKNIRPVECLTCHKGAELKHRFHPQLAQAIARKEEPSVSCKDCHGTHNVISPKEKESPFNRANISEGCGQCHGDVVEQFAASAHGGAFAAGVKGAPECLGCHGHDITPASHPDNGVGMKLAQERLCLTCHLDNPDVRARTSPSAGFIAAYEQSVHGRALMNGNDRAPNCVDCHGSHQMAKGYDPAAKVSKLNIAGTCSKCHGEIADVYNQSAHGVAVQKGVVDAPTCTDCHGEHTILKHTDPKSPVARQNLSAQVCSPCHSSVALSTKYGIESDRFKTFSDSYHGLAIRGGSVEVANCASCHGTHNIKSSADSTSMISKANLAGTCGSCHPGANERFTIGRVHVDESSRTEEPMLYWIATAYILLIVLTIGGMLAHNALDFVKKSRRKLMIRRGLIPHPYTSHELYPRMSKNERVQHAALLLSFMTLVVTGFMLRFPEVWWVQWIRALSDSVFDTRSLIHRVAGVVMLAASFYHVWYVFFTVPGRRLIFDMLPRRQDAKDAIAMMKYNLGLSGTRPLFDRFCYIEKAEYWALLWGTSVMGVTGLIMWFDNTFIGLLTKLGYDVARTIHYYEAWLATLAVIVWHFYFVIFNPDVYPLNVAFWKGTLTEEEMEEDHPLELRRIVAGRIRKELPADEMMGEKLEGKPGTGTPGGKPATGAKPEGREGEKK
ncbi:MAG TPA: cytochrome b/b6 domain-containing protein [Bacteroidota bacterium]|nr:cytochrome b/b6 domain-containing protein [Bacteroidota bacterium]